MSSRPRPPLETRDPRPRRPIDMPVVSLMWPAGAAPRPATSIQWEADLGMSDVVAALALNGRYTTYIRQILTTLVTNPAVIHWRQAVLLDFIRNPALIERAQMLLPRLAALQQGNALLGKRQRNLLLDTADHLAELDSYLQVTLELQAALSESSLESSALLKLRDNLAALIADPQFQELCQELPELRAPLERITSLTVGINLDVELRPESAVLLAINDFKVGERLSWLERVIGVRQDDLEESGIAPLHRLPEDPNQRVMSPLFQDLDRLLTQIATPIAKALTQYARSGSGSLQHLEYELAFFTAAARTTLHLMKQGITFCQPVIAPATERVMEIEGLVNLALALRDSGAAIPSNATFGESGRIAILTGPNSGGKTTYLRSIGLAQAVFQAGLLLPAQAARISPVDVILTHFPALETRQHGRLAEEALRLREVFGRASATSLVLLNETFSSTSSGEALYLAMDMLAALRALGARAIFATHLIELVERKAEIEAMIEGDCRLFSLVAGVVINEEGEAAPTYQIMPGLPLGRSYARDIARRHGISLEQVLNGRIGQA